jgi:cell wall-associated NlpC family hydrolase
MHFASQYVGLLFKNRGRTKEGVDCWGLVRLIYKEQFNIQLPSYDDEYDSSYNIKETGETIAEHSKEWEAVEKGSEKTGDVIVMRLSGYPTHVGLVLEKGRMLHIIEGTDAIVENYEGRLWQRRIVGFFRHKEFI